MDVLEQGFDEVTQYYQFKPAIHRFIRTTYRVENINQQIRRREKVIRIFLNYNSAIHLIGEVLMDIDNVYVEE